MGSENPRGKHYLKDTLPWASGFTSAAQHSPCVQPDTGAKDRRARSRGQAQPVTAFEGFGLEGNTRRDM